MEEPRPEPYGRGQTVLPLHLGPELLESAVRLVRGLDIGLERDVAPSLRFVPAGFGEGEELRKRLLEGRGFKVGIHCYSRLIEGRLYDRQLTFFLVFGDHLAREHLSGLHVRLVEGMYTYDHTGDGNSHLPSEELTPQVVDIPEIDTHHRIVRLLEGTHLPVVRIVIREAEVNEEPVVRVEFRLCQRLPVDGEDTLPVLTRALGYQLLDPGAEARYRRGSDERDFIAPGLGKLPEYRAQPGARIVPVYRAVAAFAVVEHRDGAGEQRVEVHSLESGGGDPDEREGGVSSADIGVV